MISVIVPYVAEYPQVIFTIRSIHENLAGRADHEIIAVDNYCQEVEAQGFPPDRGTDMVKSMAENVDWLKYIQYDEKLSHWNAKRVGIAEAKGDILCFIDAHCIVGRDALFNACDYYAHNWQQLDGTLHLPLTYHILEDRRLKYKLRYDPKKFEVHYSFTPYEDSQLIEVPCMSTCGMIIHKDLYWQTGGWPKELGIYGGGENFMNFTLSVLGKKKWIYPAKSALYHHGEKRNYQFNWEDYTRNRSIATYLFGGVPWLDGYLRRSGATSRYYNWTFNYIIDACWAQRQKIKENQKTDIVDWMRRWGISVDKK